VYSLYSNLAAVPELAPAMYNGVLPAGLPPRHIPMPARHSSVVFLLLSVSAVGHAETAAVAVRFDRDIRPILSDKCYHCHGPDEAHREAELGLDLEAPAKESAIVPGNADESELVRRILSHDPDEMMPPPSIKKPLEPAEIELLRRWVEQGAEWILHWAFVPPARPPLPAVP